MARPLREYRFRFESPGADPIDLIQAGTSPCTAKDRAYRQLEAYLQAHPDLPKGSWRLISRTFLGNPPKNLSSPS